MIDTQRILSAMRVELDGYRAERGDIAVKAEKLALELQRLDGMIATLAEAIRVMDDQSH
jgi:hypothetical protein